MKAFKADLHMHTCFSADCLSEPSQVLQAALAKGLSAIAITDHNEIAGALEAERIAKEGGLRIQVIVGEEVLTSKGDLLVYFAKKRIAPGKLSHVLSEAKGQGAICAAAHPFDFARKGIDLRALPGSELAMIGAIEALNARATLQSQNDKALLFAKERGLAMVAGSDAHHASEIGAAYVEFSGVKLLDADAIANAKRRLCGGRSSPFVRLHSRLASMRKRFGWHGKVCGQTFSAL